MQGAEQRRKLLSRHDYDARQPLMALVKCAAGIVALVVVAAGPWLMLGSEPAGTGAKQPEFRAARALPDTAVAESKRVFDERRQRYQARRQGATPETAQSAPTALSNLD